MRAWYDLVCFISKFFCDSEPREIVIFVTYFGNRSLSNGSITMKLCGWMYNLQCELNIAVIERKL